MLLSSERPQPDQGPVRTGQADDVIDSVSPPYLIRPSPPLFSERLAWHRDYESKFLALKRDVFVYLPPGYHGASSRSYPVLYVHDGQNLFDNGPPVGGSRVKWGVDSTCDKLITSGEIPPLIVVGIGNTVNRNLELLPCKDDELGDGIGSDYLQFVVKELKPFIDRTYRTLPEAQYTGLVGSSLGGLISLFGALKYPDVFSIIGGLSASIRWGDNFLHKEFSNAAYNSSRIWVSFGDSETPRPGAVREVVDFIQLLRGKGWQEGQSLAGGIIPGGGHNEGYWRDQLPQFLKFMFQP